MARSNLAVGLFVVGSSMILWGCPPGGVGDPCVPEDEYSTAFSGYSEEEVNVESRSFQCETRVCLVNHFRGRVSCPYGQDQAAIDTLPGNDPNRCHIPGTGGNQDHDIVQVPVSPQLEERRASRAVYCSCRCANADGSSDDDANYCKCPSGYSCTHLIDDLGLGNEQLAGAYCVRNGTKYDKTRLNPMACDRLTESCGPQQPF